MLIEFAVEKITANRLLNVSLIQLPARAQQPLV